MADLEGFLSGVLSKTPFEISGNLALEILMEDAFMLNILGCATLFFFCS